MSSTSFQGLLRELHFQYPAHHKGKRKCHSCNRTSVYKLGSDLRAPYFPVPGEGQRTPGGGGGRPGPQGSAAADDAAAGHRGALSAVEERPLHAHPHRVQPAMQEPQEHLRHTDEPRPCQRPGTGLYIT